MSKIIILDENTANKIAAGEVVERPSSVVKELVENSLDSGANTIVVEIKNGGITYIKVMDNGSGMEEGDIEIAFERHATSKIFSSEDLYAISTMGFRGEALASIASVSNVELVTKTQDTPYGHSIKLSGGVVTEHKNKGCPVGTTVTVRDLFFNTPARYKFLKKDITESRYISDLLNRISLGNPQVSFKFINNGSTVLHTPGNNDLLSSVFSVYGKEISSKVFKVQYSEKDINITGYIGSPEIARASRNNQTIFVNKRYIKNKTVTSAIDEAYKTLLMKNRYAFALLNIEINPASIDVNVHPAKTEVRFSNDQEVFRSVYHAVCEALMVNSLIRNMDLSNQASLPIKDTFTTQEYHQENMKIENNVIMESPKEVVADTKMMHSDLMDARIIGQVFSTYILLELDKDMIMIDQHAAHERIMYDSLVEKYRNSETLSQTLLTPITIELSHDEVIIIQEEKDFLNKLGFIFENFGNNSIILRAVPYAEFQGDFRNMFLDMVDITKNTSGQNYTKAAEEILYMMACKAAVKANSKLEYLEIKSLLKELSRLDNPYSCPHGRPTMVKITLSELEKKFKRIV